MTERPAYFVVARALGAPTPMLYWDELPRTPIRNLEYVVRLDQPPYTLGSPHAPLHSLFAVYQRLQRVGKLPPRWEPPQKNLEFPKKTSELASRDSADSDSADLLFFYVSDGFANNTRAALAAQRLEGLGYGPAGSASVVRAVLDVLAEPDRDMLDAGLADLNIALGPPSDRAHGTAYRCDLLRVIWHSMLDRAR